MIETMDWIGSYSELFHTYRLTKYQLMEIISVSEASIKLWHSIVLENEKLDGDFDKMVKGPARANIIRINALAQFLSNPAEAIEENIRYKKELSGYEERKLKELSLTITNLNIIYKIDHMKTTHTIEISEPIRLLLYATLKEYCSLMFKWENNEFDCGPLTY